MCARAANTLGNLLDAATELDSGPECAPESRKRFNELEAEVRRIDKAIFRKDPNAAARIGFLVTLHMSVGKARVSSYLEGSWPQHHHKLTSEDYATALRLFTQKDNSEKWRGLAAIVEKAGMGRVSPESLAGDWRKYRRSPCNMVNPDAG